MTFSLPSPSAHLKLPNISLMSRPSRAENTKEMYQKVWYTCRVVVVPEWNLLLVFDVLVTMAVVLAVVVFKLCIKAWTAHLTKNSWIPFWLPSFLSCCHLELGVYFLRRFVLVLSVSPFLIGQALWVASRFTPLMTQQLLARWVECFEFPQGYWTEFCAGRLRPEIQPLILPFYIPFVTEKVTSFVYL